MTPGNALVTGAGRRIGRAIAEGLAKSGWAVAVHAREAGAEVKAVAAGIVKSGRSSAIVAADLTDEAAVKQLIPRAAKALRGPLTLLVNNASAFEHDDVDTATRASWDRHMEANLRAPFVLMQEFARALPEEAEGVVVNLLDQRVWNLTDQFVSYTVAKAGLWTLTQTMALALAPRIRVCGIGPGPTMPSKHQSEEQFAAQAAATPLGIPATTADILRAVQFIVNTPSFTGQMIALDAGQHLMPFQRPTRDE
jgi:NAD(P)-dependent dehydrogenase (short-subunit alcohol dehydrogenase family)